ncbi:MAG TPA: AAC(3) family N-acetyltransferase [Deinococcales bacterium]|nr:AAC(3) family N-acetyltransferase [Deinococcales bacterium]
MFNLIRRAWSDPVHEGDIERALEALGLNDASSVLVHSSLSSFGRVAGGAGAVIAALTSVAGTVVMPAFSYDCLVWPAAARQPDWPRVVSDGPRFYEQTPVSRDIGRVAQVFLDHPGVQRSFHPALSFSAAGPQAASILEAQTLDSPYAPIGRLYDLDGDVLLIGVDNRSNTTIHYGEFLAGRPLLDRYVRTRNGVERTYFPNCSAGFNALAPRLTFTRQARVGRSQLLRLSVRDVVDATVAALNANPEALLCSYSGCRCQHVRRLVRRSGLTPRPVQPSAQPAPAVSQAPQPA